MTTAAKGWPQEPPATTWRLPDPRLFGTEDEGRDLVAVGGDLQPGTVLAAYRLGLFPMHVAVPYEVQGNSTNDPARGTSGESVSTERERIGWWSPDPRGVLPLADFRQSRSTRQSAAKYRCTVNESFAEVVAGCADRERANGWINDAIEATYQRLHGMGWAHSVEVWQNDELVGGLYGVAIGGLFAGESMFYRSRDASKVALSYLVRLLCAQPDANQRLLDVQWLTEHLETLGAIEVERAHYLQLLDRALELPVPVQLLARA